jgi:hypothetical protein
LFPDLVPQHVDLDTIRFCELVKACTVYDGEGTLDSFTVSPESGPTGTTFVADMVLHVTETTGPDELIILLIPPGGMEPSEDGEIIDKLEGPQYYDFSITMDSGAGEEPWPAGDYTIETAWCQGECGSAHKYSKVFGEAAANFTITH